MREGALGVEELFSVTDEAQDRNWHPHVGAQRAFKADRRADNLRARIAWEPLVALVALFVALKLHARRLRASSSLVNAARYRRPRR